MPDEIVITTCPNQLETKDQLLSLGVSGWGDLVMRGYKLTGDEEYENSQINLEYLMPGKRIIFAQENGLAVASLVLSVQSGFSGDQFNSFGVNGIVTLPEYQGKGLGKRMYQKAIEELEIDCLTGSTKSPSAVLARSSAARRYGMRTFYGYFEVTSEVLSGKTRAHEGLLKSYLERDHKAYDADAVFYKDVNILPPTLPSLTNTPDYLREPFELLTGKQIAKGDTETAAMPLISIKNSLLY